MSLFTNPSWIDTKLLSLRKYEDIPNSLFDEINLALDSKQKSDQPIASVVIPARNEESNIIRTIHSLAMNKTKYPFEILVVNNNSTDRTQEILDKLHIRSCLQKNRGCGPARQLGQELAKGKYILMADADCIYPSEWIEGMINALKEDGISCVYGRYSFLSKKNRLKYFLYESTRDIFSELRHLKRPYLNALGMSMGYERELGLGIGFIDRDIRGEDGRMCFDLMKFGKIRQLRSRKMRVWTWPRTLEKEGGLVFSFARRLLTELPRVFQYFFPMKQHDTKGSKNRKPWFEK